MKSKYFSPMISVEILEKEDILLASGESSSATSDTNPTEPAKRELENSYRDISDFIFKSTFF